MLELSKLSLFFIATLVLLLTPGPAVLYIIARSVNQGRRAGLVSTLGLAVGTLFHVAAASLGISALLLSSVLVFNVVKYLGAVYLIYLGIRQLLARKKLQQVEVVEHEKTVRIFSQGVLVNLLNPKTALFFFAFLPQFVDNSQGAVAVQSLLLGFIYVVMGIFSDGIYALLAGTIGHWLRGNRRFLRNQRYFTGTVYICLGATAALSGSSNK